jgi:ribonuclease P/MRP protein subunit POP5
LPSLRQRKRYLAFEIISKGKIDDFKAVSEQIWHNSLQFMGELEAAKAGIWLLGDKFSPETQKGLIRVGHKHVHQLKASLALIKKINNKKVIVRSLGLSGILKKAEQKYLS